MSESCFPGTARLRKREEFDAVFRRSAAASNQHFRVLCGPNGNQPARLGLAIAKKVARHAVDRNRLKRIVRESFRHAAGDLAGFDFVVLARAAAVEAPRTELRRSIDALWTRATQAPMKPARRRSGPR